jgi:hypothetical protein
MACGALVLVGATVVGASALSGPSTQLLKGSVIVTDSDGFDGGKSNCSGTGGYSDLDSGAQVTIKNGDGKMLASTELGPGRGETWTEVFAAKGLTMPSGSSSFASDLYRCILPFETKVPKGEKFYSITVGSSGRRGTVSFTKEELAKNGWTADVTIGS